MQKSFKFRLYPSKEQRAKLEQTLNTCRILYNNALAERRDAWKNEERSVGYHEQAISLPEQKGSNPYLPQVHSQVLQDTLRRTRPSKTSSEGLRSTERVRMRSRATPDSRATGGMIRSPTRSRASN
jgi:transposase